MNGEEYGAFGGRSDHIRENTSGGFAGTAAIESDLAAGTLAEARVAGLEPARDFLLVRAAGRPASRAADAFLEFARKRLAAVGTAVAS